MAASVLLSASSFRTALLLRIGRRSESMSFQCGAATALAAATFFASVQLSVSSLSSDAELSLIVMGHTLFAAAVGWFTKSPGHERFVPLLSAIPTPLAVVALSPYADASEAGIGIACWYAMTCVAVFLLVKRFASDGDLCARAAQQLDMVCAAGASVLLVKSPAIAGDRSFIVASSLLVGGGIWCRINSDRR